MGQGAGPMLEPMAVVVGWALAVFVVLVAIILRAIRARLRWRDVSHGGTASVRFPTESGRTSVWEGEAPPPGVGPFESRRPFGPSPELPDFMGEPDTWLNYRGPDGTVLNSIPVYHGGARMATKLTMDAATLDAIREAVEKADRSGSATP